ncbi:hypothetical protein DRE_00366 [Drechslerella stenobrocha 248]|uniref:Microsomal glutathione S-transferase 3 n=1 Tax=Drechslerella stenobrocha 248 TaxID=1043628 RepID=W7I5D7_9PEZI|nr:hypothetical protein DRE_00366 [Drechslerella stenobrocha 248]
MDVTIPSEYGYVLLVALAGTFVNQWHSLLTSSKRKKAQVPYPICYATDGEITPGTDKYVFNCAQRAHANYVESMPQFYVSMMISGLTHPQIAAGLGATYLVGRIVYAIGYVDPGKVSGKGRLQGSPFIYAAQIGLWGYAGHAVWRMIMG